jgi:hypothetical protein
METDDTAALLRRATATSDRLPAIRWALEGSGVRVGGAGLGLAGRARRCEALAARPTAARAAD